MASTYTDLGLELMATGENAGTWGDKTNTNLQLVQQGFAGYQEVTVNGTGTTTLDITDGTISNGRNAVIKLIGTITGNIVVTIPDSIEKAYTIINGTSGAFTVEFKTVSGSGFTFSATEKNAALVYSDGTNIIEVSNQLAGVLADSAIGSTVQAYDAGLTDIAGLAVTNSNIIVGDGTNWVAESGATARASLGLATGDDVQFDSFGVGTAASGTTGEIRATNDITAFYSDKRLKNISGNIDNALNKILNLNGVYYTNNEVANKYGYLNNKQQVGVIAQEVEEVLPQIVKPAPFDIGKKDDGSEYSISGENYKTVQYEKLIPLLIEGIKELNKKIEEMKNNG
jgi:hypothetical protein